MICALCANARIDTALLVLLIHMTSPRVIELPRRLEPVVRDTFLGADDRSASRTDDRPAPRTDGRVATVVALRPRGARRPAGRPVPPLAA